MLEQRSQDSLQKGHPYSISNPSQRSIPNQSIIGKSTSSSCDLPKISSIEVTLPDPPAMPSSVQENERKYSNVSSRSILQGDEDCKFIGIQANTAEILEEQVANKKQFISINYILKADELQKKLELQQSINKLKENYELNLQKLRDEHKQELDNGKTKCSA